MMEGGQKETTVSPGGAGIGRGYLQICGAPVKNFAVLAAARVEKQKGRGRGGGGGFIAAGRRRLRQGVKGI
jgi:hypothetical protein